MSEFGAKFFYFCNGKTEDDTLLLWSNNFSHYFGYINCQANDVCVHGIVGQLDITDLWLVRGYTNNGCIGRKAELG